MAGNGGFFQFVYTRDIQTYEFGGSGDYSITVMRSSTGIMYSVSLLVVYSYFYLIIGSVWLLSNVDGCFVLMPIPSL